MSKIFKCNEREFYQEFFAQITCVLELSISTLRNKGDMYLKAPPQVFKYLQQHLKFVANMGIFIGLVVLSATDSISWFESIQLLMDVALI